MPGLRSQSRPFGPLSSCWAGPGLRAGCMLWEPAALGPRAGLGLQPWGQGGSCQRSKAFMNSLGRKQAFMCWVSLVHFRKDVKRNHLFTPVSASQRTCSGRTLCPTCFHTLLAHGLVESFGLAVFWQSASALASYNTWVLPGIYSHCELHGLEQLQEGRSRLRGGP